MTPLRITRSSGFGSKPPQDHDQSPIAFGTASSCDVRFDPGFDKGVGPQHCRLEWNGEAWWLLDGGYPVGTWVSNRRIAEPCRVDGIVEFRLGQSGPQIRVEPLSAPQSATPPPPATAPAPTSPTSGAGRKTLAVAAVLVAGLLIGGAAALYWKREEESRGLQWSQAPDSDGLATLPATNPVYTPPPPPPVQSAPMDLSPLIDWIADSSSQGSSLLDDWQPVSGASPFIGTLTAQAMEEQFSQLVLDPPQQYMEEPGGGLPPQPPPAIWTTEDTRYATELLLQAEYGSNPPPDTEAQGGLPPQEPPAVFVPDGRSLGQGSSATLVASPTNRARLLTATRAAVRDDGEEAAPEDSDAPKVWGVFVGIDDFETINDIVGCKNDAIGMAKTLMLHGLLHPRRTYLMTEKMDGAFRPTGANIKKALNEVLTKADPQDLVIFFFSGHGGEDAASGETVFPGVDFTFDDPYATGLTGSALQALIRRTAASKVLMLFDACHAGGLAPLGRSPRNFRSGPSQKFLDQLAGGRGHVVIRAAGKDEYSIGDDKIGHGVFTFVTLAGLTGAADRDRDGIVTLNELRPYVTSQTPTLAAELGHEPFHPSFTSGGQEGESGEIPLTTVPAKTH